MILTLSNQRILGKLRRFTLIFCKIINSLSIDVYMTNQLFIINRNCLFRLSNNREKVELNFVYHSYEYHTLNVFSSDSLKQQHHLRFKTQNIFFLQILIGIGLCVDIRTYASYNIRLDTKLDDQINRLIHCNHTIKKIWTSQFNDEWRLHNAVFISAHSIAQFFITIPVFGLCFFYWMLFLCED